VDATLRVQITDVTDETGSVKSLRPRAVDGRRLPM
jgi:hypothetical protein